MATASGVHATVPGGNEAWVNSQGVKQALVYLHYAYPLALFMLYFTAFMIHSVYQVPGEVNALATQKTGPGGKPLPRDKSPSKIGIPERDDFSPGARISFSWGLVGVISTFLADAILICVHALADRKDNWWCGKPVAVSNHSDP